MLHVCRGVSAYNGGVSAYNDLLLYLDYTLCINKFTIDYFLY